MNNKIDKTASANDKLHPEQIASNAFKSLGLSQTHSDDCLKEADHWLKHDGLDDPELIDLTQLPFVTIDNEDSRDLDQALHIERTSEGYRVMYALADASYYVRPGSALFSEALRRGTTYYTPLIAAPMLPASLSEGLISLNPDVTRRSLVFDMHLDNKAGVFRTDILRAKICSAAKLSYGGVQRWLDSDAKQTLNYHPGLTLLKEVGEKLMETGKSRGVVGFNRTETRITIAGSPPRFVASERERFDTERYNEQISLICNMQGAELLLGLVGISDVLQAVFRVHEAPLRKNLNELKATLNELAEINEQPELWKWQDGQSLAQYVEHLPKTNEHHRQVLAIQRQIMQAQRGSTFTPEPGEHHALKASSYARFSSPMREVVGIFTHKELLEALNGGGYDNAADQVLREAVINAANTARQQQRKLDKIIEFSALHSRFTHELNNKGSIWHAGTIMGIRADKLYISIDNMALDVKIYRNDLENLYSTQYINTRTRAKARDQHAPSWQLGQGVKLQLRSYEEGSQRFVFAMQPL